MVLSVIGLLMVGTAGFFIWKIHFSSSISLVAPAEKASVSPLENPSIAVLPFRNLSDDRKQDYFCDGMTDDIITDLTAIHGLSVISRNSTFTYKGQNKKNSAIARELNVRYILEGSVRRSGDQVRINVQLTDAQTDHQVWAERLDSAFENVFQLQDKISAKIIAALALKLSVPEKRTIADKGTHNPAAYDAYLKGMHHIRKFTPQDYLAGIDCFKTAIKLDPKYSRPE